MKAAKEHKGSVPTRGSGNYASEEAKEIARLQHELRDTKDALEVLKKAIGILGNWQKLFTRLLLNTWKKRVPSDTFVRRAVLKEEIQKLYEDSHQNYVRQMGIKAQWVRLYIQTTIDSDFSQKLKNILNEEFNPAQPDAVWCSDITYIWNFEGFVYLTSIMDLYSRKIIS